MMTAVAKVTLLAQGGSVHCEPNLSWQIIDTADVNGDGMADVIWRHTDARVWVHS